MAADNSEGVGFTARLSLGDKPDNKYDVLSFGTSFSRDYDQKGRPSSAVRAGDMSFTIEITDMASLVEMMINAQNAAIKKGVVEFWQSGDSGVFRKVEFENAYITSYKEGFQPAGSSNFSCDISITAEKITIGTAAYAAGWPTSS